MRSGAGCQWSRSTRTYLFEGPDGKARLFDLFDGRRQLIIYHFMFDPSWDDGCPSCTNLVDNTPFRLARIQASDTSLVLVSRAPLAKLDAYKARMNWTIPWFSSYGSDFNYDFDVTDDERRETWAECVPARGRSRSCTRTRRPDAASISSSGRTTILT